MTEILAQKVVLTEENVEKVQKEVARRLLTTGKIKGNKSDIINDALTYFFEERPDLKHITCPRCSEEFDVDTDTLLTNCRKCGKFIHVK